MASKRQAAQALRKAANLIEKNGWHQGHFISDEGAVCALGAVNTVACGAPAMEWGAGSKLRKLALDALGKFIGGRSVPRWNDSKDTTKNDVLKTFRKTARALEHGLVV
jgi:hypothetical protein